MIGSLCAILALLGLIVATSAQEEDIDSVVAALAGRAEGLMLARCSVCHSTDLITQQRLPAARWNATIEKMRQWGADLSIDETRLLVRYLSARYHPGAPDLVAPISRQSSRAEPFQETQDERPLAGIPARGAGIYAYNCRACHGPDGSGGMGPKLSGNPILTREDLFWETVLHGRGAMPGWSHTLTLQEIADVFAWLSAQ